MNDIDQRLAAMNSMELRNVLFLLVDRLRNEDVEGCYQVLRDNGLEQDLTDHG